MPLIFSLLQWLREPKEQSDQLPTLMPWEMQKFFVKQWRVLVRKILPKYFVSFIISSNDWSREKMSFISQTKFMYQPVCTYLNLIWYQAPWKHLRAVLKEHPAQISSIFKHVWFFQEQTSRQLWMLWPPVPTIKGKKLKQLLRPCMGRYVFLLFWNEDSGL